MDNIRERIKKYKELAGIKSFSEIANRGDLKQSTLHDVISGKYTNPRIDTLKKIACGLGVELKDLIFDYDDDINKDYRIKIINNELKKLDVNKLDSLIPIIKALNEKK